MRIRAGGSRIVAPTRPSPLAPGPANHPLLGLQQSAGNRATTALVQRRRPAKARSTDGASKSTAAKVTPVTRTTAQVASLQKDILTVIQQMELAAPKAGQRPAVTESSYHTSSGIRASYASRMQATIPWTLGVLSEHPDVRANFGVTTDEIAQATNVITHVDAVWRRVMKPPGMPSLDVAKSDARVAAHLGPSGLDDSDLGRMLAFAGWRHAVEAGLPGLAAKQAELAALNLEELTTQATGAELAKALKPANQRAARAWRIAKKKGRVPPALPADLTASERKGLEGLVAHRLVVAPLEKSDVAAGLGIDAGSARRYVAQEKAHEDNTKISAHWTEDRAAWERFAVEKVLPDVGAKIATASTDDEGMTLGHVQIADDVAAISRAHPTWDDNQLARQAFKKQNGDSGYADTALAIFTRLHTPTAT